MPRRQKARSKSKKKSRKKRAKRPYKLDKHSRARHRYRKRRHKTSVVHGHKAHARQEAEMTNYLLNQMLKTMSSTEEKPYHYHPRHHENDPEFAFSDDKTQEFKKGFPAPDVNLWRPQGRGMPPSRGNFPGWEPQWVHTYGHPHAP